jgi:Rad3-related DNA helicase
MRRRRRNKALPNLILDPRILTKNYGNAFLRALSKCPVEVV